jgi:glycosyltransferase involved in cell wall biosynthesis
MASDFHNTEPWRKIDGLRRAGHPVLFVDQIGVANPRPRNIGKVARLLARRLGARRPGGPAAGVPQLQLVVVPPRHTAATDRLNRAVLRRQILRRTAAMGFRDPILWYRFPVPELVGLADALGAGPVVYECVDRYLGFDYPRRPAAALAAAERRLLARADLTIVTSEGLRELAAPHARRLALVRQGSDVARFSPPAPPVPADLARLPRPWLGYTGPVDERLDGPLLAAVARAHPRASFVVVGPIAPTGDEALLRTVPNVHLLGRRPAAAMPAYVGALDVALLPYRLNAVTTFGFPVKAVEYLAAGRPCVGAPLPEIRLLGHVIAVAEDARAFTAAVSDALAGRGVATPEERRAAAAEYDWPRRIDALTALIEDLEAA